MPDAVQTHCDRCETPLRRNASYCDRCGERTHRSRRLIRLAVRVEILFIALVALVVFGFTFISLLQPAK